MSSWRARSGSHPLSASQREVSPPPLMPACASQPSQGTPLRVFGSDITNHSPTPPPAPALAQAEELHSGCECGTSDAACLPSFEALLQALADARRRRHSPQPALSEGLLGHAMGDAPVARPNAHAQRTARKRARPASLASPPPTSLCRPASLLDNAVDAPAWLTLVADGDATAQEGRPRAPVSREGVLWSPTRGPLRVRSARYLDVVHSPLSLEDISPILCLDEGRPSLTSPRMSAAEGPADGDGVCSRRAQGLTTTEVLSDEDVPALRADALRWLSMACDYDPLDPAPPHACGEGGDAEWRR